MRKHLFRLVIYNTKHITPLTIQNAYAIAYTLLPHHAIGCKAINEKGKIFVPQKRCVLQGASDKLNFIRMPRKGLFHKIDDYQILAGYIGAYRLIEDEKIKNQCCDILCLGNNFSGSMDWFLDTNPRQNLYNIFEILLSVDDDKKSQLLQRLSIRNYRDFDNFLSLIFDNYFASKLSSKLDILSLQVDYLISKARKPAFLQQIFSVRNEGDHKVLRILGLKIKFRRRK